MQFIRNLFIFKGNHEFAIARFCSLGRDFETSNVTPFGRELILRPQFLQIPPHDGHPCHKLTLPTVIARSGLSPYSYCPCWAHQKNRIPLLSGNSVFVWRSVADSNRRTRFCRPLPSHSANRPCKTNAKITIISYVDNKFCILSTMLVFRV
mgnify:CR=1 FL=1